MNLDLIKREIEQATPYQLLRLSSMLQKMMDDPERIQKAMDRLRVGEVAAFWDHRENREIEGVIERVNISRVILRVKGYASGVAVPISLIADSEPLTETVSPGITRDNAFVGQAVGWVKNGREYVGTITKLNPKTASVSVEIPEDERIHPHRDREEWKCTYSFLHPVLSGEVSRSQSGALIGEIL